MNRIVIRVMLLMTSCVFADRTSIMDATPYRRYCLDAARDPKVFSNFRQYVEITGNIETVTPALGECYLDRIHTCYSFLMDRISDFAQNDTIGNPKLTNFPEIGLFSPTTLRYVCTAGDMMLRFGAMDGWKVIEIGGGYGGQCKILSDLFSLRHYTIVDLPETLELAKTYLQALDVPNMEYAAPDVLPENPQYDLVISNFAFSECSRSVQTQYLEKIIRFSKRGYMICNFVSYVYNIDSYSPDELKMALENFDFKVQVVAEEPSSVPDGLRPNLLYIWSIEER